MENNGWIDPQEKLPKDGQKILVLDYTYDDILINYAVFFKAHFRDSGKNGQVYVPDKWELISGGIINTPAFWRDIILPEIVEKTLNTKEN